jgi:acyl-homoserine lactone acylase PvdQ
MSRRALSLTIGLLIILPVFAAAGLYWVAKRAEPAYSGRIVLAGLEAKVKVRFGPHAIPTVEAETLQDLVMAQGYLVARERLWQMDLLRRLAGGRLAEILGTRALRADAFFRTIGIAQQAERSLAALGPEEQTLLAAYATGVNAYLAEATSQRRLPLEYRIAGVDPMPWRPEDSLLIGGYMAWSQSHNLRSELTFLRLALRVGADRARELFPVDVGILAPQPPPELVQALASGWGRAWGADRSGASGSSIEPLLADIQRLGLPVPTPASNAWAVNGPRVAGGQSLLANDPHLAASMPGIWYEMELMASDLHVAGVSLPGVPLIMIGHNRDLAWGFTSTIADTQDLFIERLLPDGERVERQAGPGEPIATRIERIAVRGAAPVDLPVRSTSNGVVINAVLGPATQTAIDLPALTSPDLLVLRQAHDLPDLAFAGLVRLNQATTLEAAAAAILGFRHVVLNLMVAHRDGGIALQMSGVLPQRGKGSGAFPSPGWVAGYAWQGSVPQTANPALTNPPGGALITANNRIVPADYPITISNAWLPPFRAERIRARLDIAGVLTPTDMAEIQMDRLSTQALLTQRWLRTLEMEIRAVDSDAWSIATELLGDWDGEMSASSRPAALFAMLEPALYRALYADELGDDLATLADLALFVYSPLQETLNSGRSRFWDDVTTVEIEQPAEIWARALKAANADLNARASSGEEVRLDQVRTLTFPHAFGALPVVGRLFNVGPIPVGGHADSVGLMKSRALEPGQALIIPTLRAVFTPSDWTQIRAVQPLGQSGHRFSAYRTDQLDDWLNGRTHPWPWFGPSDAEVHGILTLEPVH